MNINDSKLYDKNESILYKIRTAIYIQRRMEKLVKAKHTNTCVSKEYIKFLPT